MQIEKKCPVCNAIVQGRSDKIYCSNFCKNDNSRSAFLARRNITAPIDAILHRNYQILYDIFNDSSHPVKVKRRDLVNLKFDFNHFVGIKSTKNGKNYYQLYNLAWLELPRDMILVVKKLF